MTGLFDVSQIGKLATHGAAAWGNDYYANLVVWALPMAQGRIGLAEFCRADGFLAKITS